jgi:2-phosphosulfolactate phosphatase
VAREDRAVTAGPRVSIVGPEREAEARGTVVVLDVIRAYTTASMAFAAGVARMVCVRDVSTARELHSLNPDWLIAGEDGGGPVEGFHFDNSPYALAGHNMTGRTLIFRTTNGTRGLAAAVHATTLLAAAATNASATAQWILANRPDDEITLVCTDTRRREDPAVAEYIAALLDGRPGDRATTEHGIYLGAAGHMKAWGHRMELPEVAGFLRDCATCAQVDNHDFAMIGTRQPDGTVELVAAR